MQGRTPWRFHLLILTCLWLAACNGTPTVIHDVVEVPIIVTRIVPQAASQEIAQTVTELPPATTTCTAPAPGNVVVTIGAILPLSSPGAILAGFAMQTALNIAITDINAEGGIHGTPIRLVTYDSVGVAERAAQFAERLILLDCAVGIVGLYHNAEAMAVTDVAHRYGVPVIVAAAHADDITARGYPEVFRLAPANSTIAQTVTAWLSEVGDYNQDNHQAITIIADNTSNSSDLVSQMHQGLVAAGIDADLMRVDLPANDFSSVIARLVVREHLPDAILITIKGASALHLQAQLLNAGIGPTRATMLVQTYTGLDSQTFWSEVPHGNSTIVMRMGAWTNTVTEQGNDFAIKYAQYMGQWPEAYAFAAYDSIYMLAQALRATSSWRGTELITALEMTNTAFTNADITFFHSNLVQYDAPPPSYQWHQWLDSQILFLQYTQPDQPAKEMPIIWPPQYRSPQ